MTERTRFMIVTWTISLTGILGMSLAMWGGE